MTARVSLIIRLGTALLAATLAEVGVWAAAAPRSFYSSFPGAGHAWVAADGPYNQHLVRDVGQLDLGFAVLLLTAALLADRRLVRAVLGAYLVPAVLHLAYHLGHLGLYDTTDAVGNVTSLSLAVALPVALLGGDVVLGRRGALQRPGPPSDAGAPRP